MARCSICDRQSEGLSDYNPMEQFHSVRFYTLGSDIVCEECYSEVGVALADFVDESEPDKVWSDSIDKHLKRRSVGRIKEKKED